MSIKTGTTGLTYVLIRTRGKSGQNRLYLLWHLSDIVHIIGLFQVRTSILPLINLLDFSAVVFKLLRLDSQVLLGAVEAMGGCV